MLLCDVDSVVDQPAVLSAAADMPISLYEPRAGGSCSTSVVTNVNLRTWKIKSKRRMVLKKAKKRKEENTLLLLLGFFFLAWLLLGFFFFLASS